MPSTPTMALPYPALTEAPNGPAELQALAERLEAVRGAANGLAGLDGTGKVPTAQLPVTAQSAVLYDSGHIASAQAAFDISSIDQTWRELEIEVIGNGDSTTSQNLQIQVNGDTGANYDSQGVAVAGDGTNPWSNLAAATAWSLASLLYGSTSRLDAAHIPVYTRLRFSDYAYAAGPWWKVGSVYAAAWHAASASVARQVGMQHLQWRSTAAINRVKLFPSAGSWMAGSRCIVKGYK